eukprot:TRINITY_DN23163_c0_g1_i1.p1 TRINITY_DN23163_c0_g1~~TRINITY_DN23163_c0_g1_i1.p1  ORF type:complete len:178 (-),score=2.23 TRINITY_DN23163_c0_g1_i1:81-614(-)
MQHHPFLPSNEAVYHITIRPETPTTSLVSPASSLRLGPTPFGRVCHTAVGEPTLKASGLLPHHLAWPIPALLIGGNRGEVGRDSVKNALNLRHGVHVAIAVLLRVKQRPSHNLHLQVPGAATCSLQLKVQLARKLLLQGILDCLSPRKVPSGSAVKDVYLGLGHGSPQRQHVSRSVY